MEGGRDDPSWEFGFGEILLWGPDRKYGDWKDIKKRYLGLKDQGIKSPVKKHLKQEKR